MLLLHASSTANTGAIVETRSNVFPVAAPRHPAGLAFANGSLYVFNYSEQSGVGSTLVELSCQ